MLVTKAWRCKPWSCRFGGCRMKRVLGHPRPPSVEALVYRGCPCRDPPVGHRVQDDSVAERQPCACGCCVSCHLVADFEHVCELVLYDGVLHRETVNSPNQLIVIRVFCGMWEYLHTCSTVSAALRAQSRFQLSSPLFNVTPDVIRRISSSPVVCLEPLQLSFELKLFIRHAVCSRRSENSLFVNSRSLPLRWSWLQPSALFVVELWPLSQQPPSRLVSTAAPLPSDSTASWLLQRPGTAELFAVPPVVSVPHPSTHHPLCVAAPQAIS